MKKYFVEHWNEEKNSPRTFFGINVSIYIFFFSYKKDHQGKLKNGKIFHGIFKQWWSDGQIYYFMNFKKEKHHGINIQFKEKINAIL